MTTKPASQKLPPPYETIVIYAAYGWAVEHGIIGQTGFPKLPERNLWLPVFHLLLHKDDGLADIRDYARKGLKAWRVGVHIADCLKGAFGFKQCRSRLQRIIQNLADTARDKVTLPDLSQPSASSQTSTPKPPSPFSRRSPRPGKPSVPSP